MKTITLTLIILCLSFSVNAQTFAEISYPLLGQETDSKEYTEYNTNYGKHTFKIKAVSTISNKRKISRITITVTNDYENYDSILQSGDYNDYRVGTVWTDFIFHYYPIITKEFKNLEEARKYFNSYSESDIPAHKEVKLFKHKKKDKYKVARPIYSKNKKSAICDDFETFLDIKKWEVME